MYRTPTMNWKEENKENDGKSTAARQEAKERATQVKVTNSLVH